MKGRLVKPLDSAKKGPFFVAIEEPVGSPVRILGVLRRVPAEDRSEVLSGYPYLAEGSTSAFEILNINPDDDEYSKDFEGTLDLLMEDGFTIRVCDPLYCLNISKYAAGQKYEFSLAALAYAIEHIENTDIVITEGAMLQMERERALENNPQADISAITSVTVSMAELRTIIPSEDDADAEFQTVIEKTGRCKVAGVTVYWMRVQLRPMDDGGLPCILYASETVLKGYVPKVGHSVRGVAWVQAVPLKPLEQSPSWADSLPDSKRESNIQGFLRAMEAERYLAGLPLGIIELAKGIIAAGWDVIRNESPDGSCTAPVFLAERRGEKVDVWARSWIEDQAATADFSALEKEKFGQESEAKGQKAVFVTIRVLDVGSGYRFFYSGTDELKTVTGPLSLIEYARKVDEGEPNP